MLLFQEALSFPVLMIHGINRSHILLRSHYKSSRKERFWKPQKCPHSLPLLCGFFWSIIITQDSRCRTETGNQPPSICRLSETTFAAFCSVSGSDQVWTLEFYLQSVLWKENTEKLPWNKKKGFLSPLRQYVQSEHQRRWVEKKQEDAQTLLT